MQMHNAPQARATNGVLVKHMCAARRAGDDCDFLQEQRALARFNTARLAPGSGAPPTVAALAAETSLRFMETAFVERQRRAIAPLLDDVPHEAHAFTAWFDALRVSGPGQGDPLFQWLAEEADLQSMRWFLTQEVAGEAGFEDLVALTQLKMPTRPKLEMARNYWDEMGRGQEKGMHGPMLDRLAHHLDNDLP